MHVHVRRMKTDVLMTRTRRKQRERARACIRERESLLGTILLNGGSKGRLVGLLWVHVCV
jgi:hypothetical protein